VVNDAGGVTVDATAAPFGVTITGAGARRLFSVTAGSNVILRGLTLTGGNGTGATLSGSGGALHNAGTMTVERCTLSGNSTTVTAARFATTARSRSRSVRSPEIRAGITAARLPTSAPVPLALTHCTVSGNTATNFGGGIMISSGAATITNCIVSGNAATSGRDIWSNGPAGGVTRAGANIIGSAGKTPDAPDNGPSAITADPLLGPLADNGGTTQTRALLAWSQAIDAVPAGAIVAASTSTSADSRAVSAAAPISAPMKAAMRTSPADGLSLFARVPPAQVGSGVFFEISANADFSVASPIVSTLAGVAGNIGSVDGPRLEAKFAYPSGVAQDSLGNVFVADTVNNVVRMFDPDGPGEHDCRHGHLWIGERSRTQRGLCPAFRIAVGPDDNVYLSDTYNHRICKLTRPATEGLEWTVTTLAGTGIAGFLNGAGSVAKFNYPYGLDLDASGNVYVADAVNNRIRKVTPAGAVTTFAGTGAMGFLDSATASLAKFDTPSRARHCRQGRVPGNRLRGDRGNHRIRAIATSTDASGLVAGAVTTLAGDGTTAIFNEPSGLAADSDRNVYVADEQNHRIRKVTPGGVVTTVAGSGTAGFMNGASAARTFQSSNRPSGGSRWNACRRRQRKPFAATRRYRTAQGGGHPRSRGYQRGGPAIERDAQSGVARTESRRPLLFPLSPAG
jgi:parallel beta-helix repeat protein